MASFGFKGSDQQKLVSMLSGGERNRLNLALTLKQGGNLLLLDEPTNDLDVETLGKPGNALLEFPAALWSSPDRWFLDRIATHILAWGHGRESGALVLVRRHFQAYEENKVARLGEDGTASSSASQADALVACGCVRRCSTSCDRRTAINHGTSQSDSLTGRFLSRLGPGFWSWVWFLDFLVCSFVESSGIKHGAAPGSPCSHRMFTRRHRAFTRVRKVESVTEIHTCYTVS